MKRAFIFPGQGSQAVGMGKALADAFPQAKAVFDEVDESLSQKLSTIMWEGPAEELTLTANTQPALMAVSLAVIRVLEAEAGLDLEKHAAFVAGHSLGEYSALAAVGSLSISDTARLLRIRGNAMQNAVPVGQGAMAALLGLEYDAALEVAREAAEGEVCDAANDNGGAQVVVSGHKTAVERAVAIAQTKGAKRAVMLAVSAPFHCALMRPAQERLANDLAQLRFEDAKTPLVNNVEAHAVRAGDECREGLVRQVSAPVRWIEVVETLAREGVTTVVELGPGTVLGGLVKKIDKNLRVSNVEDPASLEATVAALREA